MCSSGNREADATPAPWPRRIACIHSSTSWWRVRRQNHYSTTPQIVIRGKSSQYSFLTDLHRRVTATSIRVTTSAALTANIATTENTATQRRDLYMHNESSVLESTASFNILSSTFKKISAIAKCKQKWNQRLSIETVAPDYLTVLPCSHIIRHLATTVYHHEPSFS